MTTENHYRWDFIGLSTDTKPTAETSEKVVNGSTYYCSDTSKLYVYCNGTWYERKALGGGGGGGTSNFNDLSNRPKYNDSDMTGSTNIPEVKTYTAGSNVAISDQNVISATDTTYSDFTGTDGTAAGAAGLVPAPATTDAGKFLKADGTWDTAGGGSGPTVVQTTGTSTTDVMSQKAVTDALAEAGGGFTTLTTDDYNWNSSTGQTGTPNCVALWLLPSGIYKGGADSSIDVRATRTQDYSMGAGFPSYAIVKEYEGTNNRAIVTYFDGSNSSIIEYYSIGEDGTGYSTKTFPNVVQTTGTSTKDVMSQNATTSMVFADPGTKQKISIRENGPDSVTGEYAIGIGSGAFARGAGSVSIGLSAANYAAGENSVTIGNAAKTEDHSRAVAVGNAANAAFDNSVALGSNAKPTRAGEVNVGADTSGRGYNSTNYRIIGGVHDGQELHDAATVAQGNTLSASAPDSSTVGVLGQLWTDTTNMHTYQCTAISGGTYTWAQRW